MKVLMFALSPLVYFFYRAWCATLTFTEVNRGTIDTLNASGRPIVFALWHDELFPLMIVRRQLPIVAVVSKSKDGELLARVLHLLGLKTARGSSSRGGLAALLQMAKMMSAQECHGCITVDGPRGPRHQAKDGAVFLANKTGAKIVPIRIDMSSSIRCKSWDRFQLPLPFSRVCVIFGDPYEIPEKLDASQTEAESHKLTEKLNSMRSPDSWRYETRWYKLTYFLCRCACNWLQSLSRESLYAIARVFAFCFWHFVSHRRKTAIKAIEKHICVSTDRARIIARKSFDENFKSFFEMFHLKQFRNKFSHVVTANPDILAAIIADKGPIVGVTAHIGAWELMEAYASKNLPDKECLVVVRGDMRSVISRVMLEMRQDGGVKILHHRNASAQVLHCLKGNGCAAFLVDHNTSRREAVFLPFLGDTAAVTTGPALLALRAKASVYPIFTIRQPDGSYVVHLYPPLRTTELTGTIQERVKIIAAYYTQSVESIVRQYPEQWFWMHKRWKTRQKKDD